MEQIKCVVKGCENKAIMVYGNKWICGNCYWKLYQKQLEARNKEIEELEI